MAVLAKLITTALLAAIVTPVMATGTNVALNKTVTLAGFFGTASGGTGKPTMHPEQPVTLANPASLTDGITFSGAHQWSNNTVWWNGHESGNVIEIDLGGKFNLSSFLVQADGNDTYFLEAYSNGNWGNKIGIPLGTTPLQGMNTRTVNASTTMQNVTKLRLQANSGGKDQWYSVSEIQAFGTAAPVPEPETYAMLLAGLGVVGVALRKRRA